MNLFPCSLLTFNFIAKKTKILNKKWYITISILNILWSKVNRKSDWLLYASLKSIAMSIYTTYAHSSFSLILKIDKKNATEKQILEWSQGDNL